MQANTQTHEIKGGVRNTSHTPAAQEKRNGPEESKSRVQQTSPNEKQDQQTSPNEQQDQQANEVILELQQTLVLHPGQHPAKLNPHTYVY